MRDIIIDLNDATIARAIVVLGQNLGLAVIAEGVDVETEAQRNFLASFDCHAYQDYFFSQPLFIDGSKHIAQIEFLNSNA